jgi:hypothetical protein
LAFSGVNLQTRAIVRLLNFDRRHEAQVPQHRVKNFIGCIHRCHGTDFSQFAAAVNPPA